MSTKIGMGVKKSIPDKQDKKSAAKIKQLEKELHEVIAENVQLEKEIAELQGQLKNQLEGNE